MKKLIAAVLLLGTVLAGKAQNSLRIDFSGVEDKITFTRTGLENTTHHLRGMTAKCGWQKTIADFSYYSSVNLIPGQPQTVTLRFTPSKSGTVRLTLRGPQGKPPVMIAYDELTASGAVLENGSFEQSDASGFAAGWKKMRSTLPQDQIGLKNTPALFSSGGRYLVSAHDASFYQDIKVKANQEVVITASVRLGSDREPKAVGPLQRFVRIDPGSDRLKLYNKEWNFLYPYRQRTGPEYTPEPPRYLDHAPWTGTYKKKNATGPNDFPGPDGLIYPDFSRAGLTSAWREPGRVLQLADFGAKPGADITAALQAAVAQAAKLGGAVISIAPGRFTYSQPIVIRASNVMIRGSGAEGAGATTLEFDYALKPYEVRFYHPSAAGEEMGPDDRLCVHADLNFPADGNQASLLEVLVDGQKVAEKKFHPQIRGQFESVIRCGAVIKKLGAADGVHRISARVTWRDGRNKEVAGPEFIYRKDKKQGDGSIPAFGSFIFEGYCPQPSAGTGSLYPGRQWQLARDAVAGDTSLEFTVPPDGLKAGAMLYLVAEPDRGWLARLNATAPFTNACRVTVLNVKTVNGKTVGLAEPLRIDFPAAAPTFGSEIVPIENSGISNLCLRTVKPIWTHSLFFKFARNCLAADLRVEKAGRNAIEFKIAKNCEIRRVAIDDGWFKDGGGTSYFCWETCYDCLADGIRTSRLRHAPNFQWGSSGCVVRNGVFVDSDLQLHAGWPSENLVENCSITSRQTDGSYGYGIFINGPQSTSHGPQGPRNVFYRNTVNSVKAGVWLGGSNEGYIFAYNRFTNYSGPAVLAHLGAFDHTFIGNRFTLFDPVPGAVLLATPDCTGIDFIDNVFQGPLQALWAGAIPPALDRDNRVIGPAVPLPPVKAPVESLFLWQKQQRGLR